MNLDRPKQTTHGWYVAETVPEGYFCEYLHPDGETYSSMNDVDGKLTGYFKTELDAYKAIYDFFFNML